MAEELGDKNKNPQISPSAGTRRLEGRTAIVTGASRGLGRAIALRLAEEGAAVAVVARTQQVWNERLPGTIGETVEAIEAAGGRAVGVCADLMEPGAAKRLYAEAREALGPIDILVNNASFTVPVDPPAPDGSDATQPAANAAPVTAGRADWPSLLRVPIREFKRHYEINVYAVYELIQLAAADMIEGGGGSIINISSGSSRLPGTGPYADADTPVVTVAAYGGSKAALEHLTQAAARELQIYNIAVNALSPSAPIKTPALAYNGWDFADFASEVDFAEAAVRLALVEATRITGHVIGHLDALNGSFRPWSGVDSDSAIGSLVTPGWSLSGIEE